MQNVLKIGSEVPEPEDTEKWHFPLKLFIALTTVLRTTVINACW